MAMILNEDQNILKDTAKEFCSTNTPISQLRELRDSESEFGYDVDTWKEMAALGWAGIPFPEEVGGMGFGYKGLGVVTEELGRYLAATPLFASVWVGGTLLNLGGTDAQKRDVLTKVSTGEVLLALALEESHRHNPYGIATQAERTDGGFSITGSKKFVLDGHVADKLIVVARTSGESGDRSGITLLLINRESDGVEVTRTKMVDSRNAANIQLTNVSASQDDVIGTVDEGADLLDAALDIARIGLASEMLGGAQECFDRTVSYLKEREQFGVPIGSFQALKHRAANMFCEIELSKSVVLEALTALDEGRQASEIAVLASLTKAKVGEMFHTVSREGIQMHGGIGMTDEFDIGFYLKRQAVTEQTFGDMYFHRNRYGELQGY